MEVRNRKNRLSFTKTDRTVDADQSRHLRMTVLMGVQRMLK